MLCESCKNKEANLHYTKIINGKMEEIHLCENCAINNQDFDFDKPFSIYKIFANLFDPIQEKPIDKSDIVCSNCGLSFSRFQTTGKFGCAECYDDFSEELKPIIKGIHGKGNHIGKIPKRTSPKIILKKEVEGLTEQLEDAVKKEDFEKAAIIRDEIRSVKDKLNLYRE